MRVLDRVFCDDPRPDGAGPIKPFSFEILSAMAALDVAGGDIIQNRIAENVIKSIGFGDVASGLADDDGQLHLVVDVLGYRGEDQHITTRCHDRCRWFGKEHRMFGDADFDVLGLFAFGDMFGVIAPDAKDVFARIRDWRHQHSVRHDGMCMLAAVGLGHKGGHTSHCRITALDQRLQAVCVHLCLWIGGGCLGDVQPCAACQLRRSGGFSAD